MKKQILLLTAFLGLLLSSLAQSVSDIQVRVSGDKILVGYTISGLRYYQDISRIDFYVSRDGGQTFEGPLKEISGDTGPDLRNGKYVMAWDVLKEMPFTSEELIFDIRLTVTEKPRKKAFMISLAGNATTPLGCGSGNWAGLAGMPNSGLPCRHLPRRNIHTKTEPSPITTSPATTNSTATKRMRPGRPLAA